MGGYDIFERSEERESKSGRRGSRHPQVAAVLLANTGDDALGGSVFFVILI